VNVQPTTAIVTSLDGVTFAVETSTTNVAYETAFAATRTAAELEQHGDFTRVLPLDVLLAADELFIDLDKPNRNWAKNARVITGGKQS